MNDTSIIIGLCNVFCGAFIAVLCIPLAKGKIKRNNYYGFRYKDSMKSEEAWKAVNIYGGKRMIAYSIGVILLGFVIMFIPIRDSGTALICGLVPMVVTIPGYEAWKYAKQLDLNEKE